MKFSNLESGKNISQKTHLIVWNPDRWPWLNLPNDLETFKKSGNLVLRWSCGNVTTINPGDRIFLIKLGPQGVKGILGSGYALTNFYLADHWDESKDKKGKFIDVSFDALFEPTSENMIKYDVLVTDPSLKDQTWSPLSSGIIIKPEVAQELEGIWFKSTVKQFIEISESEEYVEGRLKDVISKRYERNVEARRKCLEHFGHKCLICKFDFEEIYGEIGREFIHVHHKNAISSIGKEYKINPAEDLVPVCPNCHAMIHKRKPAYSIEEIKDMFTKKNK
jgi:5-methylcytosine-specific restriction protein A